MRKDPVVMFALGFILTFVPAVAFFGWLGSKHLAEQVATYKAACEAVGGVVHSGRHETICIRADAVIDVEGNDQ